MRALLTGLLLVLVAAALLPLVAFAVEGLLDDPGNLIIPTHFLLMSLLGAALAARGERSARRVILGGVAGALAALVAELGWILAIAG